MHRKRTQCLVLSGSHTNADVGSESDRRSRHGEAVRFQSLIKSTPEKAQQSCDGMWHNETVLWGSGGWSKRSLDTLRGTGGREGRSGQETNERCQERRECRRSVRDNQKVCSCWPGPSHRLGDGCDTVLSDCAPSVRERIDKISPGAYVQAGVLAGEQSCFALAWQCFCCLSLPVFLSVCAWHIAIHRLALVLSSGRNATNKSKQGARSVEAEPSTALQLSPPRKLMNPRAVTGNATGEWPRPLSHIHTAWPVSAI